MLWAHWLGYILWGWPPFLFFSFLSTRCLGFQSRSGPVLLLPLQATSPMTTSDHSHSLCGSIVNTHWNDYPSIKQWNDVRLRRWGQWLPAPSECLADLCRKAPKLGKQQKWRLWLNYWVFISTNAGFPMNMDLGSDLGNSTSTTAPQVRPDCWGARAPGGPGDRQFGMLAGDRSICAAPNIRRKPPPAVRNFARWECIGT